MKNMRHSYSVRTYHTQYLLYLFALLFQTFFRTSTPHIYVCRTTYVIENFRDTGIKIYANFQLSRFTICGILSCIYAARIIILILNFMPCRVEKGRAFARCGINHIKNRIRRDESESRSKRSRKRCRIYRSRR